MIFPLSFLTSHAPPPLPTPASGEGVPPARLPFGKPWDVPSPVVVISCLAPVCSHPQSWLALRLAGRKTHTVPRCECSRRQRARSTILPVVFPGCCALSPLLFSPSPPRSPSPEHGTQHGPSSPNLVSASGFLTECGGGGPSRGVCEVTGSHLELSRPLSLRSGLA